MQVARAIIHKIGKSTNTPQDEVHDPIFSTQLLAINGILNRFAGKVLEAYRAKTATYGCFETDTDNYPFSVYLTDYITVASNIKDTEFKRFTVRATTRLHTKIRSIYKASAEYIIFLDYTDTTNFILAVILNNALEAVVNPDFTLREEPRVKIDHLHHAARININKWQSAEDRYLSFISKSEGGADYFKDFIGGTSLTDDKRNTRDLKKAIREFCDGIDDLNGQADRYIKDAHDYLVSSMSENRSREVSVENIARRVFPERYEGFIEKVNECEIDSIFIIDKSELSKFKRLHVKGSGYTFSFDKDLVDNGTLDWNSDEQTVKIKVDAVSASAINEFLNIANEPR